MSLSEDSSKECLFHGTVEILLTMDWDSSDVADDRRMLAESLKEAFTDFGQTLQRTRTRIFSESDHAPPSMQAHDSGSLTSDHRFLHWQVHHDHDGGLSVALRPGPWPAGSGWAGAGPGAQQPPFH
jgi:hypothetical protein